MRMTSKGRGIKRTVGTAVGTVVLLLACGVCGLAREDQPTLFIEPQAGFDNYLAAAMTRKHVPIAVTNDREAATYILKSTEEANPESGAGKIARCLFAYCAGINGSSTASVEMVEVKTKAIVWAYEVRKGGSQNHQSKAEAVAKHLKQWLEKQ